MQVVEANGLKSRKASPRRGFKSHCAYIFFCVSVFTVWNSCGGMRVSLIKIQVAAHHRGDNRVAKQLFNVVGQRRRVRPTILVHARAFGQLIAEGRRKAVGMAKRPRWGESIVDATLGGNIGRVSG